MTRIIILSVALIIIAAIVVTIIILVNKDDDDDDDKKEDEGEKDETTILMRNEDFNKPKNTKKEYQLIQLKNSGYKFILIHDPFTTNGGLEIKTNLGFLTEFEDGFAHYAEHIFSGGTENVTKLDIYHLMRQFQEYANAYTWEDETVFEYFGSNLTYNTLLEYISNFIQKPALNRTFLKSEIDVVTSEYDLYNNSIFNHYDLYREYSNPEHPFYKTKTSNIGNKETLDCFSAEELAEKLINYFRILFKPENCVFLLYSSKSLKTMRLLAQQYFDFKLPDPTEKYIKIYNEKKLALEKPLFLEGGLGNIVSYNNLRETPLLVFLYHISQKSEKIEVSNPIGFLFNKKENNTLLQYLYDKNYISNFELFIESYLKNDELISFSFSLTKEGFENVDKIIEAFFSTINSIKDTANLQEILDNLKSIYQSLFINKEDSIPKFPDDINNILRYNYMFGPDNMLGNPINLEYDKNRVKEILDELSPNNSFIFIDSNEEVKSKYLEGAESHISKNYKLPYKMKAIPKNILDQLSIIKDVDDYVFKLRTKNNDYTKLTGLTKEPCYKNKGTECKYNEYNPNSDKDKDFLPYVVKKEDNILSFMKIDRSYGVPFVKGYIEIGLDEAKYKDFLNNTDNMIIYYLLLYSFNYKFTFSNLNEAGTSIELARIISSKITINFSTYNDLLEKVIQYIIDFFKEPIEEKVFTSLKEEYYLSQAENHDEYYYEVYNDALNKFKRFIILDNVDVSPINKENVTKISYSAFKDIFTIIKNLKSKLTYLTYGDISLEQSESTTNSLSSLIEDSEINLLLNEEKKVILPNQTSILYSYKSLNKYERQGGTLVMYEFDESLYWDIRTYTLCTRALFMDSIRTKKGSGYEVITTINYVDDKYYFVIFVLGKVYSPEKMDRFINEAILESFSFKKCLINEMDEHSENIKNSEFNYAEKRLDLLKSNILNPKAFNKLKNKLEKDKNVVEYEKVINNIKEVFIDNPKRISILCHRGDITDDELQKQIAELDQKYFLNPNITNDYTEDIDYLSRFLE